MAESDKMSPEARAAYDEALRRIEVCRRDGNAALHLSGLGLTDMPPEIGKLTALNELFLEHNQLIALPPGLGNLTALTTLGLSNNQLTELPPELGKLTELTQLLVRFNHLTELPAELGELTALTHLYLHDNRLTELPAELGELTALTQLYLPNNQLTELPAELGKLTALTTLYVDDNQLTALPAELGKLTALTTLGLSNNQLTELPSELSKLTALTRLYFHGNRLTSLPSEIRKLTALTLFSLRDNRLALPAEVLSGSAQSILDYYFSKKGDRPLNEVKLLLVGRGEAGKTSVSRALRGENFTKDQKETPGIEIKAWPLKCPEGDVVKVHVWDFAGQEITHETHRFFLTERSLYVVVLDGRGGQQMEEAEYWLSHVEKFGTRQDGERSPVILVLNKWASPGPYDVEKRRLQREYPNIKAFVETDCATRHGIDRLRETICAVLGQMPSVRQKWPTSYYNMRQSLLALSTDDDPQKRRHFLKWEAYRAVCVENGVTEQERQHLMAENLNALGVALYYGSDERLRDTRVLNPNWAANGLYGIVRGVNCAPHNGQRGFLWTGNFPAVLAEGMKDMDQVRGATIDDYPEERDGVKVHEFLLELMVDRELGFQADTVKGKPLFLLPGLLTLDEPEVKDFDVAAHIDRAQVRFRYLYDLLPAGVMSRFIVRTHALSDKFRWQRGVVLEWGNARALVMAERRRNPRMDVFIAGGTAEERQELAGVVRTNMETIHRGLPDGLRGKEELDLTVAGDQYESVEKLEKLEKEGKALQVVTSRGSLELPVQPELEQVQPAEARTAAAPKLKVFVSYSHKNYQEWERLKAHLNILTNRGKIDWWFDGKIREGSKWDDAIRKELRDADIVILLLSTGFFESKYIDGVELKEARKQNEAGRTEILPVLLEPSAEFAAHEWLKTLQTVPSEEGKLKPISKFNPRVNGWHLVDSALREAIDFVASRKESNRWQR